MKKFTLVYTLLIGIAYGSAAPHSFKWKVDAPEYNNLYGHEQYTDENSVTRGMYYVLRPDGRIQTFNYYVNGNSGFRVDVSYSKEREGVLRPKPTKPPSTTPPPSEDYEEDLEFFLGDDDDI